LRLHEPQGTRRCASDRAAAAADSNFDAGNDQVAGFDSCARYTCAKKPGTGNPLSGFDAETRYGEATGNGGS
jgi:hypothetical protein